MSLQTGKCLQDVHLMKNKINLIITEEKIFANCICELCKTLKERAMEIINYEKQK